jgi:CO dehydrogenase/acetyl-CoA synthase gamma subunit (corrinoid Fe-S protein)
MVKQEFADLYPLTDDSLAEYLPGVDCRSCGFSSCLEFAEALIDHKVSTAACPEIDPKMGFLIDTITRIDLPKIPYNIMMESFTPGIMNIGSPVASAPVLVTGNFIETVKLLQKILEACKVSAFLIMSDTKGYSLDNAVVEKRFSPFEILKAITESEIGSLVNHRNIVIPGLARHLSGQIKQTLGWQVLIGPVSGFELPLFLFNEDL